ncbi:MAG TPA: relaxase/mobilization nuclease domain-containing protein, partial [Thermoanaerobaculia bacterium]|nr:relaxase/mobilization nuclease domain-containing protein [Thermoanaerobaculia bacterium]
ARLSSMIQKLSNPGAGFRGVLSYVLAAKKQPELLGGTMSGETARELAREFGLGRALNPAVGKPVFHGSLTAAPGDRLSDDDWRRLAERYLERLGYGDCQWVAVRHRDTANDHVHIVASRINSRGKRVRDRQERKRGEAIVRDLERELGLTRVAPSREASREAPGRGELAAFARTGEVAVKARLQEHVDLAARDAPGLAEFAERLALQGVRMRAHGATTGSLSGLSFELDGVSCKGSDLGRRYSWRGLAARTGLNYEPARDLALLRALGALPAVRQEAANSTLGRAEEPPVRQEVSPSAEAMPREQAGSKPPSVTAKITREDLHRRLREEMDRAAKGGPTLPEFVDRLRSGGVEVRANIATTGRLSGLSFEIAGCRVKGSELGRDYAWRALSARHGITFEPARDRPRLERSGVAAPRQPAGEPLQEGPPQAAVYRAAAVLRSRVEVDARATAFNRRLDEPVAIAQEANRLLEERAKEAREVPVSRSAFDWGLRVAYEDPETAGARLMDLLAREDALRAGHVLQRSPERLGRLRGVSIGGWHSAARRDSLAAAAYLGQELEAAAVRQQRFAAGEPAAAAAKTRKDKAGQKVGRLMRALGQLSNGLHLENDMVRAAAVLGARLTLRLAPAALAEKLVQGALRAALDLARGRDDDRSLGR